jgi:hypothetical protein
LAQEFFMACELNHARVALPRVFAILICSTKYCGCLPLAKDEWLQLILDL